MYPTCRSFPHETANLIYELQNMNFPNLTEVHETITLPRKKDPAFECIHLRIDT